MTSDYFKNFMNKLADASGEYIRSEFGKAHAVESKADASPVTIVDKTTEQILRDMIKNVVRSPLIRQCGLCWLNSAYWANLLEYCE